MLANQYFYLTNCCCGAFQKHIKHVCKINSGSNLNMTQMNLKLATGATSGDLNYVVQTDFCSRKRYYQTIINYKQESRAEIDCECCLPIYNIYHQQTYLGNIVLSGCLCCKSLDVRNHQQNLVYTVQKQCLTCFPSTYKIRNVADSEVGQIQQGTCSCQSCFQCMYQVQVNLPEVSTIDKRLLLSTLPFKDQL